MALRASFDRKLRESTTSPGREIILKVIDRATTSFFSVFPLSYSLDRQASSPNGACCGVVATFHMGLKLLNLDHHRQQEQRRRWGKVLVLHAKPADRGETRLTLKNLTHLGGLDAARADQKRSIAGRTGGDGTTKKCLCWCASAQSVVGNKKQLESLLLWKGSYPEPE